MRREKGASNGSVPAAQYLRMSREHQRYAMRNQASAIAAFALKHGYKIVGTYTDPGRSGLSLRNRPGLKALLAEAVSPNRRFSAILVLDVSRWGRFQDLDQSAHYEFLCREAGVSLVYCAEPFDNDGSPSAMILKQIKRLMAAEYSRELSAKVRSAQLLQAGLGYKQGGSARYGFRRLVIDRNGNAVQTLTTGQRKMLSDHRVIYVRGPDRELAVIREIFRMYTRDGLYCTEIAGRLNHMGVLAADSAAWTHHRVRAVLKNQLVVGDYVYNLTTQHLREPRRPNPPSAWIKTRVVEPIIGRPTFQLAQRRLVARHPRPSEAVVLSAVRHLLRTRGYLSRALLNQCLYTPGARGISRMFGSMEELYKRVGYSPKHSHRSPERLSTASDKELLDRLRTLAEREGHITGTMVDEDPSTPSLSHYRKRFGSILRAYQLAGLPYNLTELWQTANARRRRRGGEASPAALSPRIATRSTTFSDEEMLECLRRLHGTWGYIGSKLIRRDRGSPCPDVYVARFGSLLNAYELAGIPYDRSEVLRLWAAGARPSQKKGN